MGNLSRHPPDSEPVQIDQAQGLNFVETAANPNCDSLWVNDDIYHEHRGEIAKGATPNDSPFTSVRGNAGIRGNTVVNGRFGTRANPAVGCPLRTTLIPTLISFAQLPPR